MSHQNKVQLNGVKEIPDHGLHRLRHEPPAPIGLGEDVADLPAPEVLQLRVMGLIVLFDPQRADDPAPVLQDEDVLPGDETGENGLGFRFVFVGRPPGHLAHAVHAGVGVKVLQVRFPPGAQGQPFRLQDHGADIDGCVHFSTSLK